MNLIKSEQLTMLRTLLIKYTKLKLELEFLRWFSFAFVFFKFEIGGFNNIRTTCNQQQSPWNFDSILHGPKLKTCFFLVFRNLTSRRYFWPKNWVQIGSKLSICVENSPILEQFIDAEGIKRITECSSTWQCISIDHLISIECNNTITFSSTFHFIFQFLSQGHGKWLSRRNERWIYSEIWRMGTATIFINNDNQYICYIFYERPRTNEDWNHSI